MKAQYSNQLSTSFGLWFEHELLNRGEAYTNVSGQLYNKTDNDFSAFRVVGSPYSQWVADASISGANIPTGIFINNVNNPRNTNGLKINFGKGQVVLNSSVTATNITASYAIKDFNIYFTNEDETTLLFKNKYVVRPTLPQDLNSLPDDSTVFPCIFIKFRDGENLPFAFGGQDISVDQVRAVVISDDRYKLDAALSIFRDSAQKCFSIIDPSVLPFNAYGDLKSGNYFNYNDYCNGDFAYISKVKMSKATEIVNERLNPKALVGFIDFKVEKVRTPRI